MSLHGVNYSPSKHECIKDIILIVVTYFSRELISRVFEKFNGLKGIFNVLTYSWIKFSDAFSVFAKLNPAKIIRKNKALLK